MLFNLLYREGRKLMNYEINKIYNGFKLIEEKQIDDISSMGRVFLHEKSGAKLINIENSDDNKVFAISFKTLPDNSTGVFHILEHSVLCGSRKFPSKEPFVELAKGSLNTYLNAATYADKTMYPIASKNDKDFRNLMDVYLDAVFYPNIYKYPEIMRQEGWHYEYNKDNEQLSYKGVVYNEMQGVYSSPESLLFRGISSNLFPDTPYRHDSGGNPMNIPELTEEQFLSYHKKYYHPSNSYIYLYGKLDIIDQLKFIDENYLCDFERNNEKNEIVRQSDFKGMREESSYYPIAQAEDTKEKTYLSLNFVLSDSTNRELLLAFDLLEDILLETAASPLKSAIVKANICKDVFGVYNNSLFQTYMSVVIKNSDESEKDTFKKVVFDTLKDIVKKGIDKDLIDAVINSKEFDLREGDYSTYPKGLVYCEKIMNSILHNGSTFQNVEFKNTLEKIKSSTNNRYFENLIEKYLLNSSHSLLFSVVPKNGLSQEIAEKEKIKLEKYKASLSEEQLSKITEQAEELMKRQSLPDSKEDLLKIPLLTISDVNRKIESYDTKIYDEDNYKILYNEMDTNGINYVSMYFDAANVKQEDIPYITLLAYFLSKMDTKSYSYESLSNQINIHTGGIDFDLDLYSDANDIDKYYPKFIVRGKCINEKSEKLLDLFEEIINYTKFEDKNRFREIFYELKSRMEMIILSGSVRIVGTRLNSYFSHVSQYNEAVNGLSFYEFLLGIHKDFNNNIEGTLNKLIEVSKCIFNRENLIIGIGSSKEDYEKLIPELKHMVTNDFKCEHYEKQKYNFSLDKSNEALITSSNVQYVAKGNNYSKFGFSYTGKFLVLRTIANYDYLWNNIRVKGGAYGVFINFRRNGNMSICSYRDPNISGTLQVYDEFGKYLENFNCDRREMTKYILGTINSLDTPLSNSMICEREAAIYISKLDKELLQREREEVLDTKLEDIQKLSTILDKCMEENYMCVLGGKEKIEENKEFFKNIINIFE